MNAAAKPVMSPAEKTAIGELRKKPLVAWPTVILLWSSQIAVGLVWYGVLTGQLSLWLGCVINVVAYYALFTPAHDSMHKAVSRKGWINDLVLYQTSFGYLPFTSGKLLGLMHMQHHRFANDRLDPDHDLVKHWSNALFLWFFWDFRYLYVYLKNRADYPPTNVARAVIELIVGLSIMGVVAWYFPIETLVLWFIPTRIMVWLICLVFMYLPHVPHTVKDSEAPYQATLMREGWGWLLTPLMMYQNYHLVHHLYPTVPFYRYKKVWDAAGTFHESQRPAKVKAFGLQPYNLASLSSKTGHQ
ncbi:MAG: fatty acid desaturase [Gammaproteobacteria bacterium]